MLLAQEGKATRWQVVGVVRGFGVAETAGVFTTEAGFEKVMDQVGLTQGLRVVAERRDPAGRENTMRGLEREFARRRHVHRRGYADGPAQHAPA